MGLDEYRRKRDFDRTPEPAGGGASSDGLRYVIQKHDASHLHYDFRLELDGVLKSWAVPKGPSLKPGVKRLAMQTEDHPMDYGGFEGVIPKGQYGGGTVMLWDRGVWTPEGDPARDYRRGRLRFRLEGEKLAGSWILTRMKKKPGEKKASWLLIKSDDEAARADDEEDVTDDKPLSVATGRDLDGIAADEDRVWDSGKATVDSALEGRADVRAVEGVKPGKVPARPGAQLAKLVSDAPSGDDWVHELKFDGYRILARIESGDVRLITRNGKDWTEQFAGVAEALSELSCESAVIDGEVVVLDRNGRTSFQLLQNSLSGTRAGEPLYYAFDLLHLDGQDVTEATLLDRKALLRPLLATASADRIRYSDHVQGQGPQFFEKACGMGVEGIISKRADAKYRAGRGRGWLKVKCTARQEFVVVGYTDPSGSRLGFGALLLGVHDNEGRLVYTGKVGTGFDDRTLASLEARLSKMERKTPPVEDPPTGYKARGTHWVTPELVAEIEFTEWTGDGKIRHPSFQGLREDKKATEVVRESVAADQPAKPIATGSAMIEEHGGELRVAGVRVTSPGRVVWEKQGVTKRDLIEYYVAVEQAVLPRIMDRPLTLVRCPSGAGEKCFYQKHANESVPDLVPRVSIQEEGDPDLYMYIDGLPSLLTLVQLGVLELHIWGSRRDRLDRPDRLVFDLDPDEDLPFGRVADAALRLRDLLRELGLESWPKGSGGKGLHVVAPITRRSDWDEAKAFTHAVARRMVADDPDSFTANMSKSKRGGRIFVDYLRNARNATAIAEYSPRARPGAPVAVPLSWDEVNPRARKPPLFTIRDVPARVADIGDPWTGFDDARQSITKAAIEGAEGR